MQSTTEDSSDFSWHFCPDQLSGSIAGAEKLSSSNNSFRASYASVFVPEGAIISIRNSGELWHLPFDESFTQVGGEVLISGAGDLFDLPRSIELVNDGGVWKALVSNSGNANPVLVEFGNGFVSSGIASSYLSEGNITATNGSDLVSDSDTLYYFIGSDLNDEVNLLKFAGSLSATPLVSSFNISGANGIQDIEVVKTCEGWRGLATSKSSNQIAN